MKKIIKEIIFFCYNYIGKLKYYKYCLNVKKKEKRKYLLFCTPVHGNIGDQAIAYAEECFFNDLGIHAFQIPTYFEKYYINAVKKNISREDVILIHGGGFMGSHWINEELFLRKIIKSFPDNKIIIFPQTIYYEDTDFGLEEYHKSIKIYNDHKDLTIFAREDTSYQIMKKAYPKCRIELVPDIVLYLNPWPKKNVSRKGILLCFRSDKEVNLTDEIRTEIKKSAEFYDEVSYIDTVVSKYIFESNRYKEINKIIHQFSQSKLVITDRLHGMVLAYLAGTPCIVMGNNNHKVKGVYNWLNSSSYVNYVDIFNKYEFNKLVSELYKKPDKIIYQSLTDKFNPLIEAINESR